MRSIHYSQQLHNKRIVTSQVFIIRFSLELKLRQCMGLIDLIEGGVGLCGTLYLSGARLCYFGLLFRYKYHLY